MRPYHSTYRIRLVQELVGNLVAASSCVDRSTFAVEGSSLVMGGGMLLGTID